MAVKKYRRNKPIYARNTGIYTNVRADAVKYYRYSARTWVIHFGFYLVVAIWPIFVFHREALNTKGWFIIPLFFSSSSLSLSFSLPLLFEHWRIEHWIPLFSPSQFNGNPDFLDYRWSLARRSSIIFRLFVYRISLSSPSLFLSLFRVTRLFDEEKSRLKGDRSFSNVGIKRIFIRWNWLVRHVSRGGLWVLATF